MAKDEDDNKVVDAMQKGGKDPKSKLREEFDKEWQPKLSEQRKKTVNAIRAANNEKKALHNLADDYAEEKESFETALKDVI